MPSTEASINNISFALSDEQRELIALAHEFAANELRPAAAEFELEWRVPTELLAKAAEAGLLTYAIPEEYGGGGVDAVTAALLMEELTWGDPGLATLLGSAHLFAMGLMAADADETQRAEWLTRMCRPGGTTGAIAFSESHAGSDFANIRATATKDGDDWVHNGEKTWITGGSTFADAMLVFARTGGAGASGISAFIVEGEREGVSSQKLSLMGLRGSYTGSIFLNDVHLPANRLVGPEGGGFSIAMAFFAHSRPQVGAASIGIARAAFEYAVQYANEREAFGKPLMTKQGVSFMLADMGMKIEAARALVLRAADTTSRGEDAGLVGSYAKAFASDVAMEVTTNAVQILGGAGLSTDHPVERWMRDAKVLQIVEGTNQIQRLIASRYYSQGITRVP
ncbi:MAG: acyl-CoA dehydrogenase family protein [Thermoleophilia bacterium]|nr:acyl-CoA dehydrogenase family protein [Thermoleophilia bacterium]